MDMKLENDDANGQGTTKKRNNKKSIIIVLSSVAGVLLLTGLGIGTYIHTTVSKYDNLIMPGITVEGVEAGNRTKEELIADLNKKYTNELGNRKINIVVGEKNYSINFSDLNVKFNVDEIAEEAFNHNKELGTIEKFNAIKSPESQEMQLEFTYSDEVIKNMVATIESEVNVEKQDATITKSGSGFDVSDHVIGKKLDVQAVLDDINAQVISAKEGNIEVTAHMEEDQPTKTKDALATVDTMIATASTTFGTGDPSRVTNITIGAKTINGTVLMPGESFSFNTVIGDTTPDKGYQEGGVYVGDKVEKGYGGGICQVSSTLHNAVLRTGILPDQRTNHSMTVGYVDLGLDATISYGYIDYVFTNPYDYPIYIEGYASGGKITFSVYSNSTVNAGKTYGFVSDVYDTVPLAVKYEDDTTLEVGKEVVKQQGSVGHKVKAYRITYTNGSETNRELLNDDTYASLPKIIKRGTKAVTEKPAVEKPAVEKPAETPAEKPSEGTTGE